MKTLKVRDELQGGLPFERQHLRWATEMQVPRDRPAGRGWMDACCDDTQRNANQKAWALDADGEQWWPVEVVSENLTTATQQASSTVSP